MKNRERKQPYHPDWNFVLKNTARYSLMTVALITLAPFFGQISSQAGPYYDKLIQLNEVISQNPLGLYILNSIKQFAYILSSGIPQYHIEGPPTVPIAQLVHTLAVVGSPIEHVIENALTSKREKRKLEGVEPVRKKESPKHVLIGPSQVISDLAQQLFEDKPKKRKKPVVAISTKGIPARYGQEIDYYFEASDSNAILDTFPTKDSREFIEFAGIDRADEITVVCFNPDNAIFYGSQTNADIGPDFVSTLIRNIAIAHPGKLKGKKINVIFNETKIFAKTTEIEEELKALSNEYGFIFNPIKPEKQIIDKIKSEVNEIQVKTEAKKKLALVGQGNRDEDRLMLERFYRTLSEIDKNNIEVTFISNEQAMNGEFGDHDFYICYGDTDNGTSTLAENVSLKLQEKNISRKILALVERNKSLREYKEIPRVDTLSIYDLVVNGIK
jgi:hypothetical protein